MTNKKVTFGRVFWPSLIAAFIVSIIGIIIFTLFMSGLFAGLSDLGKSKSLVLKNKTVLHMELKGAISERSSKKFDAINMGISTKMGLSDILEAISIAKKDKRIKGIFIEIDGLECGYSTVKEIRKALIDFQKEDKFVMAYNSGELITQKEFYLSSAANKVYGFPYSGIELMGLGGEMTYYKNTLDKLDIEVQIIRGSNNDFKSAVEPFFLEKMSDSSRLQVNVLYREIWNNIKSDIAESRNIPKKELNLLIDELKIRRVTDAVKYKLMDGAKYRDEIMVELAKLTGEKKHEDIELVSFEKFMSKKMKDQQLLAEKTSPNIAVILAEGAITVDGTEMTSKDICKQFQKARNNPSVKTIVFRVNSPGGSALASEQIWREVKLTQAKKKVIVSMGDVAASGGYYVATPASTIFAEPTTITGSIGVFGMLPYTGKMFENKLGITFDRFSTNAHSTYSPNRKLTASEISLVQEEVDNIYTLFLKRVAEGRGMSTETVNLYARGRVWNGVDAKRIGLVDELGGLQDAINYAAKTAGIAKENVTVIYYPLKKDDKFAQVLEILDDGDSESTSISRSQLPEMLMKEINQLRILEERTGVQMRMPFDFKLN